MVEWIVSLVLLITSFHCLSQLCHRNLIVVPQGPYFSCGYYLLLKVCALYKCMALYKILKNMIYSDISCHLCGEAFCQLLVLQNR